MSGSLAREQTSPINDPEQYTSLTATSLQAKLQASDLKFARVIFQLMAPMLEGGHLSYLEGSGWGYKFSDETVTVQSVE
jgi:hypothetical protein